jgi:TPR repeat protein
MNNISGLTTPTTKKNY